MMVFGSQWVFIVMMLNYIHLAPHQLSYNSYLFLWILSDLDKYLNGGAISRSHFKHYFKVQMSLDYEHMYMISKKPRTSLIFKNMNKTDYTDDCHEVGGSFYKGEVTLRYLIGNNYNFLSSLNINWFCYLPCWSWFLFSVFDDLKKVQEKNICNSRNLEKISKLSMAVRHAVLHTYHRLSDVFPYTLEEWS